MKEDILDESDTTRGSRVVIDAPHRLPKGSAKLPSSHKKAGRSGISLQVRQTTLVLIADVTLCTLCRSACILDGSLVELK